MLTRVVIGKVKVLCSAATEAEIREMYAAVKEQQALTLKGAQEADGPRTVYFQYETVGPLDVVLRGRRFILWGSPHELRFYTPEEFEVLREG